MRVEFIKHDGDHHILVQAKITCAKTFMVPKQKVGKFLVGRADETSNFQQSYIRSGTEVSQILEFLKNNYGFSGTAQTSNSTQEKQKPSNDNKEEGADFKITKSPQVKRKGSKREKGQKSDIDSSTSEGEITPSN